MSELTRRQRWILLGASLGVGLAFLDETAVVTALRDIQRTFGATSAEVQWVMGAYLLALASLMAAAGRLADLYGRRRLFLVGAGVFGAGSIACAAAPDQVWLIVARGVQGSGGALLMPLGYANGTSAVPEQRHGWAVGIISTGATVFLALGPLIGGAITELAGWRWIFVINIPLVAAVMMIAIRSFPEMKGAVREPLDLIGLVLLILGLGSVVLALLGAQDWGAGSPAALTVFFTGIVLLVGFVVQERRTRYPLIALPLLRIPAVTGSLCALFTIQFAILGLTVYMTLYLQLALGYSPAEAGALTLPTVIIAPLISSSIGRLADTIGTRVLTAGAMLLAAVALGVISLLADEREVALLLPAFLAFGIARPVATIAGTSATVGGTPLRVRGLASGLATQARQLGAVLSVALLGLTLTALEMSKRDQLLRGVDASFGQHRREALDGILAGSEHTQTLLHALSPAKQHAVHEAAATAFISGFRVAMLVTAVLAAAAAVAAWLLDRPRTEDVPAIAAEANVRAG